MAPSLVASDSYRFRLLTGCRGVEIHGHKLHKYLPIRAGDVDHRAGRVLLRDAKNRSDPKLLLSRQALALRNGTALVARSPSGTDGAEKTKGLAGTNQLTPVILGFPTWARTRDPVITGR
jgi:hypothetical protein